MDIKTILKSKVPRLVKIRRDFHQRLLRFLVEKNNRKYRSSILKLMDSDYLEKKIANMKQSKQIYIIATSNSKLGIYGYINCFLPHFAYALEKGFIPVVDMKNFGSPYQKENENAWEKFFLQPNRDSINRSTRKILCPTYYWYRWLPSSYPLMSDKEIALWGAIYKHFVIYNEKSRIYIEKEENDILLDPENTIGVIYRGTTYTKGQAIGHPIQPTMKMLADKVEEVKKRNACSYIYLASDEKSIVDYFQNRFPGKVIINKRVYYDEAEGFDFSKYNEDGTDLGPDCFTRENNEYLIGIEYISSINLVSKCKCLVAGACGGTTAALYMNNLKYSEKYIFNLGRYGYEPVPEE